MPDKSPSKKEQKTAKSELLFHRKKLGYRTPDRFRRLVFRRNPALISRVRSFGGHQ